MWGVGSFGGYYIGLGFGVLVVIIGCYFVVEWGNVLVWFWGVFSGCDYGLIYFVCLRAFLGFVKKVGVVRYGFL